MNRPTTRHERGFWSMIRGGPVDLELLFFLVENRWLEIAIDEREESEDSPVLETYPFILGQLGLMRSYVSVVLEAQGKIPTLSNIKDCLLQDPHASALLRSLTSDIRTLIAQAFSSHIDLVANTALCSTPRIERMVGHPEGKLRFDAMHAALVLSAEKKLGLRDFSS